MWELVDFKATVNENSVLKHEYLIANNNERKWVSAYEFRQFINLGLINNFGGKRIHYV